jgi:hypothetical protein
MSLLATSRKRGTGSGGTLLRPLPNLLSRLTGFLLLALAGLAIGPPGAEAQIGWRNDVRFSYEYDDNVQEQVDDVVRAQVARVSVKSDLVLADSANQLSAMYQGGFKRYFDVTREELDIANQFLHEGQLAYRRLLGSNRIELGGGIRRRVWQDDEFFFVNEDDFTRLWGTVALRHAFTKSLSAEIGARLSELDFEHVDEVFGYGAEAGRIVLSKRWGDGRKAATLGGLQMDLTYDLEQRTYDGRGILRGPTDDPTNIGAPDRPRQVDTAHEAGIGLSFLQPFGFQGRYRYRVNDSNSFGFEYFSHIVNLQIAQQLPWRMIAQVYGAVELRKFREPVRGLVGALDIEDTDNNVLIFSLLKEMNGHVDIEARYARYRNESINLNAFYEKNVYSLGFRLRP